MAATEKEDFIILDEFIFVDELKLYDKEKLRIGLSLMKKWREKHSPRIEDIYYRSLENGCLIDVDMIKWLLVYSGLSVEAIASKVSKIGKSTLYKLKRGIVEPFTTVGQAALDVYSLRVDRAIELTSLAFEVEKVGAKEFLENEVEKEKLYDPEDQVRRYTNAFFRHHITEEDIPTFVSEIQSEIEKRKK